MRHMMRWVFLLALPSAAGCWGVSEVAKAPPSSAQYRFEQELVDKAELVRESTQPQSARGRYAYRRGADQLLVLTRVTSFARRKATDQEMAVSSGERYDANVERAWITIPLGAALDQRLKVEDLEYQYLAGYDVDREGSGFYIFPVRIAGTVVVRQRSAESVVLDVDVRVTPTDLEPWNVQGQFTLPPNLRGVRATMPREGAQLISKPRQSENPSPPPRSDPGADPATMQPKFE